MVALPLGGPGGDARAAGTQAIGAASISAGVAGEVYYDFNDEALSEPPRCLENSGVKSENAFVRVAHETSRAQYDQVVVLKWDEAGNAPWLAVKAPTNGFPRQGVLLFDLGAHAYKAELHVVGKTVSGQEVFHFLINTAGWACARDGTSDRQVAQYTPDKWYAYKINYDLDARQVSVILDSCFKAEKMPMLSASATNGLHEIVFMGKGSGSSLYYLDNIFLLKPETCLSPTNLPAGAVTPSRKLCRDMVLAPNTGAPAVIVYPKDMPGGRAAAETVQAAVKKWCGRSPELADDRQVTDPDAWLLRKPYLQRPLIVLGNITDSRAMYALATRFMTMANRAVPGKDRYINRTVFEPFVRDVNWVVLEASSPEGLKAAAQGFAQRLEKTARSDEGRLAPFRETGAAAGVFKPPKYRYRQLDLAGMSVEDIAKTLEADQHRFDLQDTYPATLGYLRGDYDITAVKYTAGAMLQGSKFFQNDALGGHYNLDRFLKAWIQAIGAGVFTDEQANRIERLLVARAVMPQDYYPESFRMDGGLRCAFQANRHWLSSLANFAELNRYVLSHCAMTDHERRIAALYMRSYLHTMTYFTNCHRDMNTGSSEVCDGMAGVLNLMAAEGRLEWVRGGALRRLAEYYLAHNDNLGFYDGYGNYIGSHKGELNNGMPFSDCLGIAAWYYRDPELQYIFQHLKRGQGVSCTSEAIAMWDPALPAAEAKRYLGVHAVPFDANAYRSLSGDPPGSAEWGRYNAERLSVPIEKLFDSAFFRDGWTENDAFLAVPSFQLGVVTANAVARYTDLGQILLYHNSMRSDGWCRNVVSSSDGLPHAPAAACQLQALCAGQRVSMLSSLNPGDGGVNWTRTIVHPRRSFFAVLDEMEALNDGDFSFQCRWRSLYPASLRDGVWVEEAPDGVRLFLRSAAPVVQESRRWPVDGAAAPYVLSQFQERRLKKGERAWFMNVFWATGQDREYVCLPRMIADGCLLVESVSYAGREVALIAAGAALPSGAGAETDAAVCFVSPGQLTAAGCRTCRVAGKFDLTSDQPVNVDANFVKDEAGQEPALRLQVPGPGKARIKGSFIPGMVELEPGWHTYPLPAGELAAIRRFAAEAVAAPAIGKASTAAQPAQSIRKRWETGVLQHALKPLRVRSFRESHEGYGDPYGDLLKQMFEPDIHRVQRVGWARTWGLDKPGGTASVTLTLDFGEPRFVQELKVIGCMAEGTLHQFHLAEGEVTFEVRLSDDNFNRDTRDVAPLEVRFQPEYFPRIHYTFADWGPAWRIKVGQKARFLKLSAKAAKPLAFTRVWPLADEREPELDVKLLTAAAPGGAPRLVAWTENRELAAWDEASAAPVWQRQVPGQFYCVQWMDLDTKGDRALLAYTAEDALYALDLDGKERWRRNVFAWWQKKAGAEWPFNDCPYASDCLGAWQPDANGRFDLIGFGHYMGKVGFLPDGSIVDYAERMGPVTTGTKMARRSTAITGTNDPVMVLAGAQHSQLVVQRERDKRLLACHPVPQGGSGNGELPFHLTIHELAGCAGVPKPGATMWWQPLSADKTTMARVNFDDRAGKAFPATDLAGFGKACLQQAGQTNALEETLVVPPELKGRPSSFSVEYWFKYSSDESYGGEGPIRISGFFEVRHRGSSWFQWSLWMGGKEVRFGHETGNGQGPCSPGQLGVWHHAMFVWDQAERRFTYYLDGVSRYTFKPKGEGDVILPDNAKLHLGINPAPRGDYWIDDVRVSAEARRPAFREQGFLHVNNGLMQFIYPPDWNLLWEQKSDVPISCSVVLEQRGSAPGLLLCGHEDGFVTAWRLADGTQAAAWKLGWPVRGMVILSDERVAVATLGGLYVLDRGGAQRGFYPGRFTALAGPFGAQRQCVAAATPEGAIFMFECER